MVERVVMLAATDTIPGQDVRALLPRGTTQALDANPNVRGVRLDVTSPADVAAAVEIVRASGRPLRGIVNNAGVAVVDPVLSTRDEDFDFQMQVNVYGVFRVTKAFAPLVIESRGRIVNISSISAFLSDSGTAAYTMSKAAVEAFTNVLAVEMAPLGVTVIAVEPGAYNTDILKPALERSVTKGFEADRSGMKPPDEVAAAVFQAMSDARPKRRYMSVPEQAQAEETHGAALTSIGHLLAERFGSLVIPSSSTLDDVGLWDGREAGWHDCRWTGVLGEA